jgi:hypothetical protein
LDANNGLVKVGYGSDVCGWNDSSASSEAGIESRESEDL